VGVGAEAERHAVLVERPGGRYAVAEVALGGGAEAHGGAALGQGGQVFRGDVRGVDGAEARPERPRLGEHADRRRAVGLPAARDLGGLLADMGMEGRVAFRRPRGDDLSLVGAHSPHAVDSGADPHAVVALVGSPARVGTGRPHIDRSVAEARHGTLPRCAEAAAQVAGVQQRDPHARGARRGDDGVAHLVVPVVQVVELADRGDAREGHLGKDAQRQRVVAVRRKAGRELEHLVTPCPERASGSSGACGPLGSAAERPMEGVRMGVGEPRQGDAAQRPGPRLRLRHAGAHGDEPPAGHVDQHAPRQGTGPEPRVLTPEAGFTRACDAHG
jgi:hypothetical protein